MKEVFSSTQIRKFTRFVISVSVGVAVIVLLVGRMNEKWKSGLTKAGGNEIKIIFNHPVWVKSSKLCHIQENYRHSLFPKVLSPSLIVFTTFLCFLHKFPGRPSD